MATSECKRQQLSTTLSRHRENLGFRPSEDLHHQQVRKQHADMTTEIRMNINK